MGLLQELREVAARWKDEARGTALREGRNSEVAAEMKAAGFVGPDTILTFRCVTNLTAQDRFRVEELLKNYRKYQWRVSPGGGATLADALKAGSYSVGGEALDYGEEAKPFADCLLVVEGVIDEASLFEAHGSPTADKCKQYDGIAVKFFDDHLGADAKSAGAISARRAIARSTVLSTKNAPQLAREFEEMNKQSVFYYVEQHLQKVYQWQVTTAAVNSVCYVSKVKMEGWEITGASSSPTSGIDTFSKPTKTTGHLMYAIKQDVANTKKRVIYHFECLLDSADNPPAGRGWERVPADKIVAEAKAEQQQKLRASLPPAVYYKATVG